MDGCIFCKLVKGEIPCAKVYEDEKVFAFLDINPVNPGHTLVIPKRHYETVLEMPEPEGVALAKASVKIGKAVKKATGCEGINLLHNIGKAAGQLVFHAHVHLIPRFSHDAMLLGWPRKQYASNEEQEDYRKKVEAAVGK